MIAACESRRATAAAWRVKRSLRDTLGLLCALDHRHDQILDADIEQALDHGRFVARKPDHRVRSGAGEGLCLLQNRHQVVWRVLHVDIDVVIPAEAERLGNDRTAELGADADLDRTALHGLPKGWRLFYGHATLPPGYRLSFLVTYTNYKLDNRTQQALSERGFCRANEDERPRHSRA
jgi:hypothetical protein